MLTKEALIAYGADYTTGMARCLNKEDFYFKMVKMVAGNEKFVSLGKHLEAKDIKAAFEDSHALKGVVGNVALTPLFDAIEEIVEPLRRGEDNDYSAQYAKIMDLKKKLDDLIA
ncbi:MAG: Hpt domain-containing protein [Treponema sp.]|nr:Hpt domain-containing protein [Treponema sp.]